MAEYAHASTSTVVGDEVCDIRPTDKPRKWSRKIYRPEMTKRAKVSGLAHTTHNSRREVLAIEMGRDCRCERYRCFQLITEEQRFELLTSFNNMNSKDEQDSYLSGHITAIPVQRRCSRAALPAHNNSDSDELDDEQGVRMSLIVAMALSGLEPEHWNGQLKDIYDQGAFLVNIISASKTSSTASTKSSMSTDALLSPTLSQECVDFSNCFASPRNNATEKHYDNLFFQISKKDTQLEMHTAKKTLPSVVEQIKQYHVFDDTKELVYQNRNLLDLGSNLKHSFGVSHAKLPDDINGYFENRSQISRLNGAYPPDNLQNICRSNDCCFKEYFY